MPSVARVNPSQTSTEKRITTPKKAIVKLTIIKSIYKKISIYIFTVFTSNVIECTSLILQAEYILGYSSFNF